MFCVRENVTIATEWPAVCRFEMAPDFCCGVKDAFIRSFSIPTVFATVATASSLSPDNRIVLIPFCCSLEKVSNKKGNK